MLQSKKTEDWNKKIDLLLKNNIEYKYKKTKIKSNKELTEDIIVLELKNCNLEKLNSNFRYQIEIQNQKNIDLNIQINELKSQLNKFKKEPLKFDPKSPIKSLGLVSGTDSDNEISVNQNNNSLLDSIKKNKNNDSYKLFNEITSILKELQITKDQLKEKEDIIVEKDNIINILYQEIDNMKSSGRDKEKEKDVNSANSMFYSPDFNRFKRSENFSFNKLKFNNNNNTEEDIEQLKKSHLDNLDLIKLSLIDFLKRYNIQDNVSFEEGSNKDVESIIEVRMKEIKYIIVNMKKVNILFKTVFKEFSKDLYQTIDIVMNNQIDEKLQVVNNRLTRLGIELDRKID
jgi:hypothetical protein